MDFKNTFLAKFNTNNIDRKVFSLLATFIIIVGLFIAAGILFPTTVSIIVNILWIVLVTVVVIFFVLGVLVIMGMRAEAGRVLDAFLEGSLKIIDFLELVRSLWHRFVELLKEFLLFAAPFFAYVLALIVYVLLLVIYKSVGRTQDVTALTIILTTASLVTFGFLSRPRKEVEEPSWGKQFLNRLRMGFIDGFEVVLFIFFLTMDSTKVFFLPADLNIPLKANWGGYDLMTRSYVYTDHMKITLNLILITIIIEIVRNILRVFSVARQYYLEYTHSVLSEENKSVLDIIKSSIRKSFGDSKDDLTKFITLNTVLFAVFLFFPRLKLMTLTVASCANLLMDLIIRARLTSKKGSDLISRTLTRIFKL
jgi:hypothetical protein